MYLKIFRKLPGLNAALSVAKSNRRLVPQLAVLLALFATIPITTLFYIEQQRALQQEYQLYAWLRELPHYDSQSQTLLDEIKRASLATTIIQSAQPDQIVLDRMYPKGDAEVSCFIGAVSYGVLMSWLERLGREHPSIK